MEEIDCKATQRSATAERERKKKENSERDKIREGKDYCLEGDNNASYSTSGEGETGGLRGARGQSGMSGNTSLHTDGGFGASEFEQREGRESEMSEGVGHPLSPPEQMSVFGMQVPSSHWN